MSWRDLRIWMKLMVVFGACFVIYIGTTIWNNRVLQSINMKKGQFYADQALMGKTMAAINESYHVFSLAVINYHYQGQQAAYSSAVAQFNGALKAISKNATFRNEKIRQELDLQLDAIAQRVAAMKAGQLQQGLDDIGALLLTTHGMLVKMLGEEQQTIDNVVNQQKTNIIVVQLFTLLVFIVLFLVLVLSIQKSNKATLNYSRRLSEGDLDIDFGQIHKDEFGQINQTLFELQARMRVIVEHIQETLAGVKKASAEFFSSSQLISDGANNQAATSNELSSTIDQIAIIAQQSTEGALQTSNIAKNAFEGIQKGAHDVQDTFHTIEEIAEKNSFISEISYQTKILSINASVEAARASEFGKGFGVIADQVKNLAEDSQKSATEIETVSKRGVNLTRELAQQLTVLVDEFQKTSDLISEVAESGKEQYEAIQQVAMAIQDLNNITQQNASSAEELAASSEQLVNLSGELEKTLEFFRLETRIQLEEKSFIEPDRPEQNNMDVEETPEQFDQDETLSSGSGMFFLRNRSAMNDDHLENLPDDENDEAETQASYDHLWDHEVDEETPEKTTGWLGRLFGKGKKAQTPDEEEYLSHFDSDGDRDDDRHTMDEEEKQDVWNKLNDDRDLVEKMNETKTSGVRINLADNDELDNQFKKMK